MDKQKTVIAWASERFYLVPRLTCRTVFQMVYQRVCAHMLACMFSSASFAPVPSNTALTSAS